VGLTTGQFVLAWALAAGAAIAVFLHASRHGDTHATAWGIAVFLVLGLALPLYVIHSIRRRR
jgi:hypothetical protein